MWIHQFIQKVTQNPGKYNRSVVFVYNHLYSSEVEKAHKHLLTQFIGEASEMEEVEIR